MPNQGYDRINWENLPSQVTPLNAENLNHMEDGISDLYDAIGDIDIEGMEEDIQEIKQEVDNFKAGVEITQAEYDALDPEEKYNGTVYYITDANTSAITAADAIYDNQTSGLQAGNAQLAIDELNSLLTTVRTFLTTPGAGFHNSIYRGKNLGSSVSAAQYSAIDAGTFDNLFIGDYWEISNVVYRIAAFDYWLNHGDTSCDTHHVVIVPDSCLQESVKMNDSNVTTGGYVGSKMYNANIIPSATIIGNAFGSDHLMVHREYYTNGVTNNYPSSGGWYDSTIVLMNEVMVYGTDFFTPHNSLGATIPNTHTLETGQLPLFALDHSKICNRTDWWLRDVVSSEYFAYVGSYGHCDRGGASGTHGVRPAFGIKA